MEFENKLEKYRNMLQKDAEEEKLQETVRRSKEAFLLSEQDRLLSFHEFVWGQLALIRKRWWFCQLALLILLWIALVSVEDDAYVQRSMGVAATLFVILVIPEIWKNRACQSMEVELASYYTLRQIYAARMLLFGLADTLLLTLFFGVAVFRLHVPVMELMVEFLLPMTVTACICLRTLCSSRVNEMTAAALCMLWSALWLFLVLNDRVYMLITVPVWLSLLAAAGVYFGLVLYRMLKTNIYDWEGIADGAEIK